MKQFIICVVLLSGVSLFAAETYVVVAEGAVDGCKMYADRDYVYQEIPTALQGADYVQMKIERPVCGDSIATVA